MNMEDQMDMYREAFDIHGEIVKCHTCGMEMDELTVQHYVQDKCSCPECEKLHMYPQCDRCYWDNWYQTHDPETGESLVDQEGMYYEAYPECPNADDYTKHDWRNYTQKSRDERGKWDGGWICEQCGEKWIGGVEA